MSKCEVDSNLIHVVACGKVTKPVASGGAVEKKTGKKGKKGATMKERFDKMSKRLEALENAVQCMRQREIDPAESEALRPAV